MKEKINDSVSKIKLSDESKERILSDVKQGKASGVIKSPIRKYVSIAAIICVLIASAAAVAVFFHGQNKPQIDNTGTEQKTSQIDPQNSEILTEGGQKVYGGANIGSEEDNETSVTSALEQSTTENTQTSENAEASYAPGNSEQVSIPPLPDGMIPDDTEEVSYVQMNGFYVDGILYKKINNDQTDEVYDIKVFPYNSDEILDFVYEGNKYSDVIKKYEEAQEKHNLLLDIMIYFDENKDSSENYGESSEYYPGDIDQNTASDVLIVSPPYNKAFLNLVEEYKKDGKADTEKMNSEKENLETIIDELHSLSEKIIVEYNTRFAQKAKEEFIRCGIKNAEIKYDMCYIKATAKELKAFTPENKDTYALYEEVKYGQWAEIAE